jgi:hypothetical protein
MDEPEEKPSPTIEELLSRALLRRDRVVPVDIVDRYPDEQVYGEDI